jgi:hypothetical protein
LMAGWVCGMFARAGAAGVQLLAALTRGEGRVVTAYALHTTRLNAHHLIGAGADYVFNLKADQHHLHVRLFGITP